MMFANRSLTEKLPPALDDAWGTGAGGGNKRNKKETRYLGAFEVRKTEGFEYSSGYGGRG